LNSKCPRPTTLLYASRVFTLEKGRKEMVWILIIGELSELPSGSESLSLNID
jgi:hypothetical protein